MERVLSTVINCCCNFDAKILAYLKNKHFFIHLSIGGYFLNGNITSVNASSDVSDPMLHWKLQLECSAHM